MSGLTLFSGGLIGRCLEAVRPSKAAAFSLLIVLALGVGLALLALGAWLWSRVGLVMWLESALALCL